YNLACMSLYLDRAAHAMELLCRAVAMGFNSLDTFRSDPDLRSLQGTPEFERLMEELEAKTNA
ncbi:MAG: TPR end-of-group domain-containing protein, partial [Candidatus Kapaibacterium sp.]